MKVSLRLEEAIEFQSKL